jgi:hypothetical protein
MATAEMAKLVDARSGMLSPSIYNDQDIYQQELENVFARCWGFLCHESQIPYPGDFFTTYIHLRQVLAFPLPRKPGAQSRRFPYHLHGGGPGAGVA